MKIAICDDCRQLVEEYKAIIQEYLYKNNVNCDVDCFYDGSSFFDLSNEYDLVFLDYDLPDMNGMDIATKIRQQGNRIYIVFLTAHDKYVFDSFTVEAFRYLVKPVNEIQINEALDRFIANYNRNRKISIPTAEASYFVNADDIMYIEAAKKRTKVKTTANEFIANKSISSYQSEIANPHFFRTHRGYIVNMRYISSVNKNDITLINGDLVLLSAKCRDEFNKSYMSYLKFS